MNLCLLDSDYPQFPHPRQAIEEPDGLLAVGGNLSPATLVDAYRQGIFPWYQDEDPILWWSPSVRCVIPIDGLNVSKSLLRSLRQQQYRISTDTDFIGVVRACAAPRDEDGGTWITEEMVEAYHKLHLKGKAHSVEVWLEDKLVGGIYGIAVGEIFCGESMFSLVTNGSKIAMAHLCRWLHQVGFVMLDCQLENPHLMSLGAQLIPREDFLPQLHCSRDKDINWPSASAVCW